MIIAYYVLMYFLGMFTLGFMMSTFAGVVVIAKAVKDGDNSQILAGIIIILLSGLMSYLLFKLCKKIIAKIRSRKRNRNIRQQHREEIKSPQRIPRNTIAGEDLKHRTRHVIESSEILLTTNKIDTFATRLAFLENRLSEIRNPKLEREYYENKQTIIANFLKRYRHSTLSAIDGLATEKGKSNRAVKVLAELDSYPILGISDSNMHDLNSIRLEILQRTSTAPSLSSRTGVSTATTSEIVQYIPHIPEDVKRLLWFSDGPYENLQRNNRSSFNFGPFSFETAISIDEPSAIKMDLPIEPCDLSFCEPLGYYPSYEKMNPKQRYCYLRWLCDITQPIEIGYVFVFYYGLERHLIEGLRNEALEMIIRLKECHHHSSFQSYSNDALVIHSLMNHDIRGVSNITSYRSNPIIYALLVAGTENRFSSDDIIYFAKNVGFTNDRYIKSNYDLFRLNLENLLVATYGVGYYDLQHYYINISAIRSYTPMAMANYSLNQNERFIDFPNILSIEGIKNDLLSLLQTTHEKTKVDLREMRKRTQL